MRDDLEQAYHTAMGNCLEAMIAMRRFSGNEAIEELKQAISSIEYGQRKAEEKRRREMALYQSLHRTAASARTRC